MSKHSEAAFCAILFFLFGFVLGGVISQWEVVRISFFQVKITDIIQIILVIVVGCFIAYKINLKFRKELRKIDIAYEYLKILQERIVSVFNMGRSYMDDPSCLDTKLILNEMRLLSCQISLVEGIVNKTKLTGVVPIIADVVSIYIEFKGVLTGGSFGVSQPTYHIDDVTKYDTLYQRLMDKIFEAKVELYND